MITLLLQPVNSPVACTFNVQIGAGFLAECLVDVHSQRDRGGWYGRVSV